MAACNLHCMTVQFFSVYIFVLCNLYCACESIVWYCVGVMLMRLQKAELSKQVCIILLLEKLKLHKFLGNG